MRRWQSTTLFLFLFCHGMSTHLIFPPFHVLSSTLHLYCPGTSALFWSFFMPRNCSCPDDTDAEDNAPHLIFPPIVPHSTLLYVHRHCKIHIVLPWYCPGIQHCIGLYGGTSFSCPDATDADDNAPYKFHILPFWRILLVSFAKYASMYRFLLQTFWKIHAL